MGVSLRVHYATPTSRNASDLSLQVIRESKVDHEADRSDVNAEVFAEVPTVVAVVGFAAIVVTPEITVGGVDNTGVTISLNSQICTGLI